MPSIWSFFLPVPDYAWVILMVITKWITCNKSSLAQANSLNLNDHSVYIFIYHCLLISTLGCVKTMISYYAVSFKYFLAAISFRSRSWGKEKLKYVSLCCYQPHWRCWFSCFFRGKGKIMHSKFNMQIITKNKVSSLNISLETQRKPRGLYCWKYWSKKKVWCMTQSLSHFDKITS